MKRRPGDLLATLALPAALAAWGLLVYLPAARRNHDLAAREAAIDAQIARRETATLRLGAEIDALSRDPQAIEAALREMGVVAEGELLLPPPRDVPQGAGRH